jgi:hypothetical protein
LARLRAENAELRMERGCPQALRGPLGEGGLRHEALWCSNGGERPPSLCRRSGGVKLEAA